MARKNKNTRNGGPRKVTWRSREKDEYHLLPAKIYVVDVPESAIKHRTVQTVRDRKGRI